MISEELWQKVQEAMGYTDEEMAMVKSSPHQKAVLEASPELVRRKIVAEVVQAKNCAAHKAVGAKYVIRGNGVIRPQDCADNMCLSVLAALAPTAHTVMNRIAEGREVKGVYTEFLRCPDAGVECGGFGTAMIKVTVE